MGGAIAQEKLVYVRRRADDELFEKLLAREFCYVLNCRQMGKTSLLKRTKQRLKDAGVRCVDIDLTSFGSRDFAAEKWYDSLIDKIAASLGIEEIEGQPLDLDSWFESRQHSTPVYKFTYFLQELVLREVREPIVIFFDEIDSVLSLPFSSDDFFAAIRAFYNNRSDVPELNRLSFCLMGVASPAELISETSRTPFNLGVAIALSGLEFDAAQESLTPGLFGLPNRKAGLREILEWTGGQPFLTQRACRDVALAAQQDSQVSVSAVVRSTIIENWEAKDDQSHFRNIVARIVDSQRAVQLLELYRQILTAGMLEQEPDFDSNTVQMELLLSGIVMRRGKRLEVYNRVYREVFDLGWVARELEKLRPAFYVKKLEAWGKVRDELKDELAADAAALESKERINWLRTSWRKEWKRRRGRTKRAKRVVAELLDDKELEEARKWAKGKRLADKDYDFLTESQEWRMARVQRRAETILGWSFVVVEIALFIGVPVWLGAREARQAAEESQRALEQSRERAEQAEADLEVARVRFDNEQASTLNRNDYRARQREQLPSTLGEVLNQGDIDTRKALQQSEKLESPQERKEATVLSLRAAKSIDTRWVEVTGGPPTAPLYARVAFGLDTTLYRLKRQTLNGHSSSVLSANFSPDGTQIVSASDDQTVKVWDAETGEELHTLNGHSDWVWSANFSPDGTQIVSASSDQPEKLWKVESFEELMSRACETLTPWLLHSNSAATDEDRALCDLPPRTPTPD
ncbi:MAG: AAA-like domain-containing protein [Geitlerinemataceae cyanobacterium]